MSRMQTNWQTFNLIDNRSCNATDCGGTRHRHQTFDHHLNNFPFDMQLPVGGNNNDASHYFFDSLNLSGQFIATDGGPIEWSTLNWPFLTCLSLFLFTRWRTDQLTLTVVCVCHTRTDKRRHKKQEEAIGCLIIIPPSSLWSKVNLLATRWDHIDFDIFPFRFTGAILNNRLH